MNLNDRELLTELESRLGQRKRDLENVSRRLKEAESVKSGFLSNLRNEIVNPLASILGLSQQIAAADSEEERTLMAKLIHEETFLLHFQIRNIITAAVLEAGDSFPAPAMVDVGKLIRETASSFTAFAHRKGVTVSVLSCDTRAHFPVDPEKLEIVVANLIANAVEFSPSAGEVTVTHHCGETLEIRVSDCGEGIPPEEAERIFHRFVQLESGPAKRHRGHGLGLSVSRELCDMMGGKIYVESPGTGTVAVSLPRMDSGATFAGTSEWGNDILFPYSCL